MDPHRGAPRLRHLPEYRRWLTGDLLLALGEGIGAFAMPLITLTVTGSLRATALVGSAQALATVAGMIPGVCWPTGTTVAASGCSPGSSAPCCRRCWSPC